MHMIDDSYKKKKTGNWRTRKHGNRSLSKKCLNVYKKVSNDNEMRIIKKEGNQYHWFIVLPHHGTAFGQKTIYYNNNYYIWQNKIDINRIHDLRVCIRQDINLILGYYIIFILNITFLALIFELDCWNLGTMQFGRGHFEFSMCDYVE